MDKKYFPVIVHYNNPEDHFALLLSADTNNVITADPARGLELLSSDQFLSRWSNIILLTASQEREINTELVNQAIITMEKRKENLERWAW